MEKNVESMIASLVASRNMKLNYSLEKEIFIYYSLFCTILLLSILNRVSFLDKKHWAWSTRVVPMIILLININSIMLGMKGCIGKTCSTSCCTLL